jgi:hypothetical protein
MIKKILIILTIMILVMVSTTPALAKKPPEPNGKSDVVKVKDNNGNQPDKGNSPVKDSSTPSKPLPAKPQGPAPGANSQSSSMASQQNTTHGFDEFGYNRTARIFNGTAMDWCMEKVGDEAWCEAYLGDSANDHLVMKWNAEWDRGNAEGWANPPYDAWENNEWNGKFPGGSGDVWHYKIVWVGPCGADSTPLDNGGYCIWGQFEVIMDQGTSNGVHDWFAHAIPNGYGSYP